MATGNTLPQMLACPIASEASQSDINQIPVKPTPLSALASQKQGFPHLTMLPLTEGGESPYGEDFNGLFNLVSSHTFYLQNGGTYTFNPALSSVIGGYAKNQILWYFPTDGLPVPVISMMNNNTYDFSKNPSYIDGKKWSTLLSDRGLSNITDAGKNVILDLASKRGNPTGTIIVWSTSTAPAGYLICDGAAISRATYADLFSVIGTTYGEGDGNTTFNLPNLTDRIPQGRGSRGVVGTYLSESLPNITGGDLTAENAYLMGQKTGTNGAIKVGSTAVFYSYTFGGTAYASCIDASLSSSTYKDNAPVQQNALVCCFCIKY